MSDLNKKFLEHAFMVCEAFAEEHDNFDPMFVQSLEESYKKWGRLTEKQHDALASIMEKWRMDEWYEENY